MSSSSPPSSSLLSQAGAGKVVGVTAAQTSAVSFEVVDGAFPPPAPPSLPSFPLLVLQLVTSLLGTRDILSLVYSSKLCMSLIGPAVGDLNIREARDVYNEFGDAQLYILTRTFRNMSRLDLDECDVSDDGLIDGLALGEEARGRGTGGRVGGGGGGGGGGGRQLAEVEQEDRGQRRRVHPLVAHLPLATTPPLNFLNLCCTDVSSDSACAIARSTVLQQTLATLNLAECGVDDRGAQVSWHLH